jgi:hypothetical protein
VELEDEDPAALAGVPRHHDALAGEALEAPRHRADAAAAAQRELLGRREHPRAAGDAQERGLDERSRVAGAVEGIELHGETLRRRRGAKDERQRRHGRAHAHPVSLLHRSPPARTPRGPVECTKRAGR